MRASPSWQYDVVESELDFCFYSGWLARDFSRENAERLEKNNSSEKANVSDSIETFFIGSRFRFGIIFPSLSDIFCLYSLWYRFLYFNGWKVRHWTCSLTLCTHITTSSQFYSLTRVSLYPFNFRPISALLSFTFTIPTFLHQLLPR